jgi:hypothetical protein
VANNNSKEGGCASCLGLSISLVFFLGLAGCAASFVASGLGIGTERSPYPPRVYYEPVEDVVIQDIESNYIRLRNSAIFQPGARIAVLNFRSPEGTQGGVLISDMLATSLKDEGFAVFERDRIDTLLSEQDLASEGAIQLSDLDIAERLGNLESVDFMVFGSVTLYESEPQAVYRSLLIHEDDIESYVDRYDRYREWYISHIFPFSLDYFDSEETKIQRLRVEQGVLSLDEYQDEIEKYPRREFRVVASLGVTARVVDIRSGEIIWTGQAETTDFTLVSAAERILSDFFASIQG